MRNIVIVAFASLIPFGSSMAQSGPLDGSSLRKLVTGKTIYLAAPLGGEFPLNYRPDGTVNGDGTTVGLGRFFAARETGRWGITGNQLCQRFPTWYRGTELCFKVSDMGGKKIRWVRDNGDEGIARVGE